MSQTERKNYSSRNSSKSSKPASKPISSELEKFRLLKAQGILLSIPTESSYDIGDTHHLVPQTERKETPKDEVSMPVFRKGIDQIYQGKPSGRSNDNKPKTIEGSSKLSSPVWAKEAITHYLTSFQKGMATVSSTQSSKTSEPRVAQNRSRMKTSSISSISSLPLDQLEKEINNNNNAPKKGVYASKTARKGLEIQIKDSFLRPSELIESLSSRSSTFRNRKPDAKDVKPSSFLNDNKSRLSTAEVSAVVASPNSNHRKAKTDRGQEVNIGALTKEVEEVKGFGMTMVEAYEDLSERYKNLFDDKKNTQTLIRTLKEEVSSLQSSITKCQNENTKLKEKAKRGNVTKQSPMSPIEGSRKKMQLQEALSSLLEENQDIKKTLEFLKDENDVLKKSIAEVNTYQEKSSYYKKLSEAKFKECSTLAEQIIELRMELNRSHSNFLRIQRAQHHVTRSQEDLTITTTTTTPAKLRNSAVNLEAGNYYSSPKKGVSWKDELEEQTGMMTRSAQVRRKAGSMV